ncbi:MAG: DoxX family protein [Pseudomonadota bacterium]
MTVNLETSMNLLSKTVSLHSSLAHTLDRLRSPLLLGTRLWVSWQFLNSGWIKLMAWDSTVELFRYEYQVPLLPPTAAAVAGTFGELFFPLLLVLGLFTRVGAVGLFAVNAMALFSYWHVLGGEGFEAARGQHYLWGYMLLVLVTCGGGLFSLDKLLEKRQPG